MKLYIWYSRTLKDWSDGIVIAYAKTKRQAINLAVKSAPYSKELLRQELEMEDPEIYSTPYAMCIPGQG